MTDAIQFGELRSILDGPQVIDSFETILALLELAMTRHDPGVIRQQWLVYAEQKLSAWPDQVRVCQGEYLERVEQQETIWSSLIRTLDYHTSTLSPRRVEALANATHLEHITRLNLCGVTVSWGALHRLCEVAPFKLRFFGLRKSTSSGARLEDLMPVYTSKMLSEVEELSFNGWARFGASAFADMLSLLPLGRLKRLDLRGTKIGKKGLKLLWSDERLHDLEEILLDSGCGFGAAQVKAFEKASHLTSLRRLDLRGTEFHPAKLQDLASCIPLLGLDQLDLRQNDFDEDDIAAFCSPERYPSLRTLKLSRPAHPNAGMRSIFVAGCFPELETLVLDQIDLFPEMFPEGGIELPALTHLTCVDSGLDVRIWRALQRCEFWPQLESLRLIQLRTSWLSAQRYRGYTLDRTSQAERIQELLSELLEEGLPPKLAHLDLSGAGCETSHLQQLIEAPCASSLQSLDISPANRARGASPEALDLLNHSGAAFGRLRSLTVGATEHEHWPLIKALCTSGNLPNLRQLCLWGNHYHSDQLLEQLAAEQLPDRLQITRSWSKDY